jgi:hypothetical protein
VKAKARDIFRNHASYRKEYNPLDRPANHVDTTWLLKWPKVGKDLLALIENIIYRTSPHEDYTLRQALRNGKTAQDICTQYMRINKRPWSYIACAVFAAPACQMCTHTRTNTRTRTRTDTYPRTRTGDTDLQPVG